MANSWAASLMSASSLLTILVNHNRSCSSFRHFCTDFFCFRLSVKSLKWFILSFVYYRLCFPYKKLCWNWKVSVCNQKLMPIGMSKSAKSNFYVTAWQSWLTATSRLSLLVQSFFPKTISEWNKISQDVRSKPSACGLFSFCPPKNSWSSRK